MNRCRFPCHRKQKLQSGHMQSAIWHFLEDCLGRSKPTSEKSSLRLLKEAWKRQFYARLSKQLLYNFDTYMFFPFQSQRQKKKNNQNFNISHAGAGILCVQSDMQMYELKRPHQRDAFWLPEVNALLHCLALIKAFTSCITQQSHQLCLKDNWIKSVLSPQVWAGKILLDLNVQKLIYNVRSYSAAPLVSRNSSLSLGRSPFYSDFVILKSSLRVHSAPRSASTAVCVQVSSQLTEAARESECEARVCELWQLFMWWLLTGFRVVVRSKPDGSQKCSTKPSSSPLVTFSIYLFCVCVCV